MALKKKKIYPTFNNENYALYLLEQIAENTVGLDSSTTNALLEEIRDKLVAQKTPTSVVTTTTENIPVGASEVSVFNNGSSNATVNGTILPPGFERSFGFLAPTATTIPVVANGNQVLIDYMI